MITTENNSFASRGVGNAGLTLGIIGTGLSLLQGNGLNLGGILGGGNATTAAATGTAVATALADKDMQIAKLEAEKYTDHQVQCAMQREAQVNQRISDLAEANEKRISALEVAAPLREQLLQQQIATVAQTATCGINAVNASLTALSNTVASIAKTVVPNTSVCPGWGDITITPAAATTTGA